MGWSLSSWNRCPTTYICLWWRRQSGRRERLVGSFKAASAEVLFREFPELRRKLWDGHLWGAGC
ncbi:MAG: transposase [Nitrospiraceae bacterium]